MLKTRVISGIVGIGVLLGVVFSGNAVLSIAIFILSLIGIFEFYNAVSNVGHKPIRIMGYLSCIPFLLIALNGSFEKVNNFTSMFNNFNFVQLLFFVLIVILFIFSILKNEKFNIIDMSLTLFGIFYVVFLFSFIASTRNLEHGFYYIWLIFIGAFATDTFAYFAGRLFGKRKILPRISPKKTLEGSIGGIFGALLLSLLYGLFLNYKFAEMGLAPIPLYHFIILGAINGMISQIGDWAASAIKRHVNVKDYGAIMPGHGGVLDRFDSILFVAPTVYFYFSFIILK